MVDEIVSVAYDRKRSSKKPEEVMLGVTAGAIPAAAVATGRDSLAASGQRSRSCVPK